MTFRGTVTLQDKLLSCLVYALPMASVVIPYGVLFFNQFPIGFYPFLPFVLIAGILNFQIIPQIISLDIVVFLCIYFFVVRNSRISHFLRFNTMQSILLRIILILIQVIGSLIAPIFGNLGNDSQSLLEVIFNTIFFGMTAICIYATVQCLRGAYAEMPVVSEAAYYQVRF